MSYLDAMNGRSFSPLVGGRSMPANPWTQTPTTGGFGGAPGGGIGPMRGGGMAYGAGNPLAAYQNGGMAYGPGAAYQGGMPSGGMGYGQQGSPGRGFVPSMHPDWMWNRAGQMQQIPPWVMQAMQAPGGAGGPMAPGMFNRVSGGLSGITPYGGAGGGPMMAPGMMTTPQGGTMNAPALYQQYQGMAPGAARDNLVRQMQGGDSGAAYNQAMRQAGYTLNAGPNGGFSYAAPPGAGGGMFNRVSGGLAGITPYGGGGGGGPMPGGGGGYMPNYQGGMFNRVSGGLSGITPYGGGGGGPMPGTAPPGSLSAAVQAMGQGSPYAQDMLRQAAGLPPQGPQGNPSSYGLDAMRNFQSQQNAGSVTGGQPTGTQYGLDAMRNFQNQQNAGFTGGGPYSRPANWAAMGPPGALY